MKRNFLESELEECGKHAEAILDQLTSPKLSGSEYDQLLAEYNSELQDKKEYYGNNQSNIEMNENIELPEEQEPLLIGKDTNGKIVIQKGKQKIIVHAWEIKLLKKIVFCITEE